MQFYYIDRLNSFPVGGTVNLDQFTTKNLIEVDKELHEFYKFGVNEMGKIYLSMCDFNSIDDVTTFTIEYIFELVRRIEYPHRPSRFNVLYASKDIEDLKKWYKSLSENYKKYDISRSSIKLIETNNTPFIADASWRDDIILLNHTRVFSPFAYHYYAQQYWSGKISNNPKLEILCTPPIKIIKEISKEELLL